jgi:hypothetical protein
VKFLVNKITMQIFWAESRSCDLRYPSKRIQTICLLKNGATDFAGIEFIMEKFLNFQFHKLLVNCKTALCLKVYEEIASHFSETRHKPWPNVKNFVESQEPGAVILDVGCGNGKYLGLNSRAFQVSEFILEEKFKTISIVLSDWL